jgi:Calcineurin-like phosphoesterase
LASTADFTVSSGMFVVVGDSRPPDYLEFFLEDSRDVPRRVFEAIAGDEPACVVHAGDLAVVGSRRTFWQGWTVYDRDVAILAARGIRIFPVVGNHEYRGYTRSPLALFFARFEHLEQRTWYTVRIGGVLIICLNSNFSRLSRDAVLEQDRWLDELLRAAVADPDVWLVAPMVHHPPFTNVSPRYLVFESKEVQQRFVPRLLACPKVRLVVSGHVHTYEHILHEGAHFIVTGGGGSPRFKLKPAARRRHADLWSGHGRVRPFHYLRCRPDESARRLEVEVACLDDGGTWTVGERFAVGDGR